jgi:hypothetical protein
MNVLLAIDTIQFKDLHITYSVHKEQNAEACNASKVFSRCWALHYLILVTKLAVGRHWLLPGYVSTFKESQSGYTKGHLHTMKTKGGFLCQLCKKQREIF